MSAEKTPIHMTPVADLTRAAFFLKEMWRLGWKPARGSLGDTKLQVADLGLEFVTLDPDDEKGGVRQLLIRRADTERLLRRQREESGREASDDERPAAGEDRLADVMEALERIEARLGRVDFNVEAAWLSVIRVRQALGDDTVLDPSAPEAPQ